MELNKRKPRFSHLYQFLDIYEPVQSLNDSSFYYFSQPQPGFQKVSLHRKSTKKPLQMYYEQLTPHDRTHNAHKQPDNSTIIDFEYFSTQDIPQSEVTVIDRSAVVRDSQWVRKYQPRKFVELLTDQRTNRNVLTWLKSWDHIVFNKPVAPKQNISTPSMFNRNLNPNKFPKTGDNNYLQTIFTNPKKIILLAGPPGCGKTTLMRVLAHHCKYEIIEINASDDRSANNLIGKIEDIAGNDTIRGNRKPALICLDEIDGVAESQASGMAKILQYIQTGKKQKKQTHPQQQPQPQNQKQKPQQNPSKNPPKPHKSLPSQKFPKNQQTGNMRLNRPVIFICNDPFAKSLKQLRSRAHVVYFAELNPDKIVKRMREILDKEKIHVELQVLQKICQVCRNDVRSCIGVLQLIAKEKKVNNKNPKDLINRMKLSFTRDSQTSINDFLHNLFTHSPQSPSSSSSSPSSSPSSIKSLQSQMSQIQNNSLLMQTFLHNLLTVQGSRKVKKLPLLYDDLVRSDVEMRKGFLHMNQLDFLHVLPYIGYGFWFGPVDVRKVQFPMLFFQRVRKIKWNTEILKTIYSNIPLQARIFIARESIIGCYLLTLYIRMQTSSTKQLQLIACVCFMLSYGFTMKKQKQKQKDSPQNFPIFHPEIDTLLTFGSRKPPILITHTIRSLLEENYQFFKDKKEMLASNQLRDNTTEMVNKLNLNSRKKMVHEAEPEIKYRFQQGTGTKTSYRLTMSYFFD